MNKITTLFRLLLILVIIVQVSCTMQPTINGLWQSTQESGTIEFKASGAVTIVDNMSATVIGYYVIEDGDLIKFELIASDILRDSVHPTTKTFLTAKIIRINSDELQLHFVGEGGVENYLRVR